MRWRVALVCFLLMAVVIGCGDKKTEVPKNPAPPPAGGPDGADPQGGDKKAGMEAPKVQI